MSPGIKIPQYKEDKGSPYLLESSRPFASTDHQDQLVAVGPVLVGASQVLPSPVLVNFFNEGRLKKSEQGHLSGVN